MQLVEIWKTDIDKTYALVQQFPADENGFENDAQGMARADFPAYVQRLHDAADGLGLQNGWVPATKYVLIDDDGTYVGLFNLRHRLNDNLRRGAGHIGYGIAKPYRGKGYATRGLQLCLEKARDVIDEPEAYLSVHKDNAASLAVQRRCGARIDHEDEREYYTRIPI